MIGCGVVGVVAGRIASSTRRDVPLGASNLPNAEHRFCILAPQTRGESCHVTYFYLPAVVAGRLTSWAHGLVPVPGACCGLHVASASNLGIASSTSIPDM